MRITSIKFIQDYSTDDGESISFWAERGEVLLENGYRFVVYRSRVKDRVIKDSKYEIYVYEEKERVDKISGLDRHQAQAYMDEVMSREKLVSYTNQMDNVKEEDFYS